MHTQQWWNSYWGLGCYGNSDFDCDGFENIMMEVFNGKSRWKRRNQNKRNYDGKRNRNTAKMRLLMVIVMDQEIQIRRALLTEMVMVG